MIPVWFVPNRTGQYEIVCSQLCGLGHYRMRGFVTGEDEAAFDAWLAEQARWAMGAGREALGAVKRFTSRRSSCQ